MVLLFYSSGRCCCQQNKIPTWQRPRTFPGWSCLCCCACWKEGPCCETPTGEFCLYFPYLSEYELRAVLIWVSKSNRFCISTLRDWLKKLAPLFHPIRFKTLTNCDSLALVFPRFSSATRIYFEFWLDHCNVCILCDWLEWLLWFWFMTLPWKLL